MKTYVFIAFLGYIWVTAAHVDYEREFAQHHDYDSLVNVMHDVHNRCPDITRLYTLPVDNRFKVPDQTWEKRKLWVIEFSKNPGEHVLRKSKILF